MSAGVFFQVGLGDIGAEATAVVNKNVIPRLFAGRLGFVRMIPSVTRHTAKVDRYNDAPVVITFMRDDNAEIVVNSRSVSSV